jgi:hypothetical protein
VTDPLDESGSEAAQAALDGVFQSTGPYDEPFRGRITHRALLYPISYHLSEEQFAAVGRAAGTSAETSFYALHLEEPGEPFYEFSFDDYDDYASVPVYGHVALYSTVGSWGLLVSDLNHAVVGGPGQFLSTLRSTFPPVGPYQAPGEDRARVSFEGQAHEFVAFCNDDARRGGSYPWLRTLLTHVYGKEEAEQLLANFIPTDTGAA